MGGIRDEHLEWAVVNRLKRMLERDAAAASIEEAA
jgi:hypothetical protein